MRNFFHLTQAQRVKAKRCAVLFVEFFKIASCVLGGGYAILPAVEREFAEKRHYLGEAEVLDMLAVVQTVPGLIAANCATFVGYRTAGVAGAFVALLGIGIPSFTVICILAACFGTLDLTNPYMQGAFVGIRAAITGLMIASAVKMWKSALTDVLAWLIALGGVLSIVIWHCNPAWVILVALFIGTLRSLIALRRHSVKKCDPKVTQ